MVTQSIGDSACRTDPQKSKAPLLGNLEQRAQLAWAELAEVRAGLDAATHGLERVAYRSDGGFRSGKGALNATYKFRARVADLRQELKARERDYKNASDAFLSEQESNPYRLKVLREEWERRWQAWHDAERLEAEHRREEAQERFESRDQEREAEAEKNRPSLDEEPLPQRTTLDYETFLANEFDVEKVDEPDAKGDVRFRCPFPDHDDSTPSCSMSVVTRGYWGSCFGCGRGFNAVTLLRDLRGIESSEERRKIVKSYGGDPGDTYGKTYPRKRPDRDDLGRPSEPRRSRSRRLSELDTQVVEHLPMKSADLTAWISAKMGMSTRTAQRYIEKRIGRLFRRDGRTIYALPVAECFLPHVTLSVTRDISLTKEEEREGREEKESFGAKSRSKEQSLTTTGFEPNSNSSSSSEKMSPTEVSVTCEGCGKPIEDAKRSSRRHCGTTCRKRAQRTRMTMATKTTEPSVTRYPYRDEDGALVLTIIRTDFHDGRAKTFRATPKGARRILYHLPKVLDAVRRGEPVYFMEGEKCADAMIAAYGVTATSAPFGGATKPTPELTEPLRGAEVVLFPDRDGAGRKWAENWRDVLSGVARSVSLVASATLDKGDDAVQHIDAGYGLDDLIPVEAEDLIVVVAATDRTQEPCDVFSAMPPLDPKEPVEPWFREWRTRHLAAALEEARTGRATV